METIIWALATGFVTGGVWVAMVLFRRQQRMSVEQEQLVDDLQRRIEQLENVDQRLSDVEERMDFAERVVPRPPQAERIPPPGT